MMTVIRTNYNSTKTTENSIHEQQSCSSYYLYSWPLMLHAQGTLETEEVDVIRDYNPILLMPSK